jgi:hypothetical protein
LEGYTWKVKEVLGLAAVLFEIASIAIYYYSIFRRETRPHLYTHLVWAIAAFVVFAGQFVSGAGPGAWATGTSAFFTAGIVILSLRYGTTDVTRSDAIALAAALLTIVPWILTKDPLWSVILACLVDVWAMLPTFRKTWNDPHSESLLSWMLSEGRTIFAFAALLTYSVTTWFYPVEVFLLDATLIGMILIRRRR